MQDSPDDVNTVATKHSAKRVSALNEHEDHVLRRRLNAYKKIHDKELNDVVNNLEEIRETMKSLTVDPTYGTHALSGSPASPTAGRKVNVRHHSKARLRRTQSFPELAVDVPRHNSFPLISAKDFKHGRTLGPSKQSLNHAVNSSEAGKGTALSEPRLRKMAGKSSDRSLYSATKSRSTQLQLHRKVERSKTAPIAMLQPLLKTTPEMMKQRRIHCLSTSPKPQGYRQRPPSPARGDADSSLENRSMASFSRRRHTPSPFQLNPDGQVLADFPGHSKAAGKPTVPASSFEELPAFDEHERNHPKNTTISPAHSARVEHVMNARATRVRESPHTRTIADKRHSAQETAPSRDTAEGHDEHESSRSITTDLKQCRYSQFVKDRPENNFI